MATKVTLNSEDQIVIPQAARDALALSAGDELLLLCKADRRMIIMKLKMFARRTAGLHHDVWRGANAQDTAEVLHCGKPGEKADKSRFCRYTRRDEHSIIPR